MTKRVDPPCAPRARHVPGTPPCDGTSVVCRAPLGSGTAPRHTTGAAAHQEGIGHGHAGAGCGARVVVSSVMRAARWRLGPARLGPRTCFACGATFPEDGPLPWPWDTHALAGATALVLTCSPACRATKELPERRVRRPDADDRKRPGVAEDPDLPPEAA